METLRYDKEVKLRTWKRSDDEMAIVQSLQGGGETAQCFSERYRHGDLQVHKRNPRVDVMFAFVQHNY